MAVKCPVYGCGKPFKTAHALKIHNLRTHSPARHAWSKAPASDIEISDVSEPNKTFRVSYAEPANGHAQNGSTPHSCSEAIEQIRAVKSLASEVGGLGKLRALIDALDSE